MNLCWDIIDMHGVDGIALKLQWNGEKCMAMDLVICTVKMHGKLNAS